MKILVLGATGMLGHKMLQVLGVRFPHTQGTIHGSVNEGPLAQMRLFSDQQLIGYVDAENFPALSAMLRRIAPDVIVNCIGVIKQRSDAKASLPSITINALLPHRLAEVCGEWGGRLIHFSTDCIFSGTRGNYSEADASDAEDLYGKSKYLGEVVADNAITLRTSIIGRELSHHKSLLDWFLSQNHSTVRGFKRAMYSGVTTNHLAEVVADLIEHHPHLSGLYQVVGQTISKYDLLCLLRDAWGMDVEITPDETFVCDRSMVGDKFHQATGYTAPAWPKLVSQLAADTTPYQELGDEQAISNWPPSLPYKQDSATPNWSNSSWQSGHFSKNGDPKMQLLTGKRILITGGTGSLGKVLVRRLLSGEMGDPAKVIVFSRDEAKQHFMRLEYRRSAAATDDVIYRNFQRKLEFRIGDIRDFHSVANALQDVDIVINAAALKQVPTCEYFPFEAVRTNIEGPENIVRAIRQYRLPIETVVGVSTDKACKPINAMGMTKALQERVFIQANMVCPDTRFVCVRYGNVLASRGSVIPFFHEQIRAGGPLTITTPDMTRFLLSLDEAVDIVFAALQDARPGETWIPKTTSALVTNIALALIDGRRIDVKFVGIRPGEKIHEILVSDEEAYRTVENDRYFAIKPMLPEICDDGNGTGVLTAEYSSADNVMSLSETVALLQARNLMVENYEPEMAEMLR